MAELAATLHTPVVKIGRTPIRLLTDSPFFLQMIHERYDGFLSPESDSENAADLTVTMVQRPESEDDTGPDIRVFRNSHSWCAERADFRLDWDTATKAGTIQQGPNIYSLDTALRILHTLLLAEQGGFLLHAASAARHRRAHLFFGPSGAGKTTIARLAPADATLLTDEISYVRRAGSEYLAYGTPFTGELGKPGENINVPIAALYYLAKAEASRLTPMTQAAAVQHLLESVLFFAEDPALVKRLFNFACDLSSRIPVYQLEFAPDQSVWELVQ